MASVYSASLPHVNSTAESFVSAYYSSWDKDRSTLKSFYLPTTRILWNGNPISGSEEMSQFIDKMPASKHDIQAFDCHPLPGATDPNLTGINIIVSGNLLLYNAADSVLAPTAPRGGPAGGQPRHRRDAKQQNEDVNSLPKFFSQAFTLIPTQGPTGNIVYAIQGETFRYVG